MCPSLGSEEVKVFNVYERPLCNICSVAVYNVSSWKIQVISYFYDSINSLLKII